MALLLRRVSDSKINVRKSALQVTKTELVKDLTVALKLNTELSFIRNSNVSD